MSGDRELKIVSLQSRSRERQLAPLLEVERYWHSLIKDGELPKRGDINPRTIQNTLEYAFIAEKVTDGLAKLRVAGSHLNDLMGLQMGGLPLGALFSQKARPTLADATKRLFTSPAVVRMELETPASVWAPKMSGDLILLPCQSDMGDVSRVLGCLITRGDIVRTPRRFDITKVRIQPIRMDAQDPAYEVTRPGHEDVTLPPAARPASHLRLVVQND